MPGWGQEDKKTEKPRDLLQDGLDAGMGLRGLLMRSIQAQLLIWSKEGLLRGLLKIVRILFTINQRKKDQDMMANNAQPLNNQHD